MKDQSATLRTAEQQRQTRPAFLYVFNQEGTRYFFTSYDADISLTGGPLGWADPQTFTRATVAHEQPGSESEEISAEPWKIGLAANDTLLRSYFALASTKTIAIQIFRLNSANLPGPIAFGDVYMDFSGVLDSVGFAGYSITATCLVPAVLENRNVPSFFYQKTCNHKIYGEFCGVIKGNFALSTTVAASNRVNRTVDFAVLTMNVDSPVREITITRETFQGGYLEDSDGNKVGISACEIVGSSTRLWLNWWPGATLDTGENFTVYPGCLNIVRVCRDFFNNVANFGGTPFVPATNPATNSIIT